jgi:hypothetical protein
MKEKGLLVEWEHSVTRLQRLNLTESQKHDAVTYELGQIVEFHKMAKGVVRGGVQEKRFKSGEQWEVLRREEGAVIVGKDGIGKHLPLDQTPKFNVFEREKITLSIGDRIRFIKNVKHRGQKLLNNELRTVVSIDEGKIKFDKSEIVRTGAASKVYPDRRMSPIQPRIKIDNTLVENAILLTGDLTPKCPTICHFGLKE